jgi:hypothetical protein
MSDSVTSRCLSSSPGKPLAAAFLLPDRTAASPLARGRAVQVQGGSIAAVEDVSFDVRPGRAHRVGHHRAGQSDGDPHAEWLIAPTAGAICLVHLHHSVRTSGWSRRCVASSEDPSSVDPFHLLRRHGLDGIHRPLIVGAVVGLVKGARRQTAGNPRRSVRPNCPWWSLTVPSGWSRWES